jgi:Zn-dependent protease
MEAAVPLLQKIILLACPILIAVVLHELAHGVVAYRLGDPTAAQAGRLTLNPIAHLDPAGTILMLVIGFGWGKPVPINPNATANPKASLALTAGAGPLSNFVVAAVAGLPLKLDLVPWISPFNLDNFAQLADFGFSTEEYIGLYLSSICFFSIILGVFNLIPIAPLDGFKVAVGLLPRDLSRTFAQLEPYGPAILIALLILPFFTGVGLLYEVMGPPIRLLLDLFAGVTGDVY